VANILHTHIKVKILTLLIFLWSVSLQAAISCRYSVSNLIRQEQDWLQVVIPTERGFEFQQVQNPIEAQNIMSSVSNSQRVKIENSLNEVADHYQSIIYQLKNIAIAHKTQLQFRLKDPDSIRNKIIDRAQAYQQRGQIFQINDFHDLAGGRLIVRLDSSLYSMTTSKAKWARLLGIQQNQILEVEIKGNSKDQEHGKLYRAVHLIVRHESGVRFELQILSKAVKHWHKWDHSHVYKNSTSDHEYLEKLKSYSKAWIQTIRLLEDLKLNPESQLIKSELLEMHKDSGVNFSWANWPIILDGHLANAYEVSYNDRFLVESNKNKSFSMPTLDRKAIKDLGGLTINYLNLL